jgi:hypothetical protein
MGDETAGANNWTSRANTTLPQTMGSWSENVRSWITQTEIPVHLLRYEDMHRDPEGSLIAVLRFCAIDVEPNLVSQAVARCSFDRLRTDERNSGFSERPSTQRTFFRSGKVGDGTRNLNEQQIRKFLGEHGAVMDKLGYPATPDKYLTGNTTKQREQ